MDSSFSRWWPLLQRALQPPCYWKTKFLSTCSAINPHLQRRTTPNFTMMLGPPTSTYPMPLVNGESCEPSWGILSLFWPSRVSLFWHSHFLSLFLPYWFIFNGKSIICIQYPWRPLFFVLFSFFLSFFFCVCVCLCMCWANLYHWNICSPFAGF
jgi:hypothetical protein